MSCKVRAAAAVPRGFAASGVAGARRWMLCGLLSAVAGCGGGGGGSPAAVPDPATPLPASLSIRAPAAGEAGAALAFSSDAPSTPGLTLQWQFGDGSTSAEAQPEHRFDRAGSFDVVLRLTNAAGQAREARATVQVGSGGNVAGLICSGGAGQGWCWQMQRPTAHRVRDVFAWSPQRAWAVGQFGEILGTDDGGAHWTLQRAATDTGTLESVHFSDALRGWAAGSAGVFRTVDGGARWQRMDLSGVDLRGLAPEAVRAVDAQTALVRAGAAGATTRDGGATWQAVSPVEVIAPSGALYDSQFTRLNRAEVDGSQRHPVLDLAEPGQCSLSTLLGFAGDARLYLNTQSQGCRAGPGAPLPFQRQTLWRSNDAGLTWAARDLSTVPGLFTQWLWGSSEADVMLAAASGLLYRSTDDGRSWAALTSGPAFLGGSVLALSSQDLVLLGPEQMHHSHDAGLTWTVSTPPPGRRQSGETVEAKRVDARTLTARGANGDFWMSRDQGASFQRFIGHTEVELNLQYAVSVLNAKTLRLLAFDWTYQESRDGGQTWTVLERGVGGPNNSMPTQRLQFLNDSVGWRLLTDGQVYRTENGGKTWDPTPARDVVDLHFFDANRGWVRTQNLSLLLTDDGGRSWRATTGLPLGIRVLRSLPGGRLVGVGSADVTVVSTDGGQTWQRRVWPGAGAQLLNALAVHPNGSVWAAGTGGVVLQSTDGGDTWRRVDVGADAAAVFNALVFADAQRGWIVGSGGRIYSTRDGGATWARQASGTPLDLHTVQSSDGRTAWVTGAQGLLLATSTGGD